MPVRTNIAIFVVLLVLLVATVGAARLPLGELARPGRDGDRHGQGRADRPVLHARPLQPQADDGRLGRVLPLAGDHGRADPQRLPDPRRAPHPGEVASPRGAPCHDESGRISTLRNSIGWLSDWSEIVPPWSILSPFRSSISRRASASLGRRAGPSRIRGRSGRRRCA